MKEKCGMFNKEVSDESNHKSIMILGVHYTMNRDLKVIEDKDEVFVPNKIHLEAIIKKNKNIKLKIATTGKEH